MRGFIAQLDTPGGHIVVCLLLIVMGALLYKAGIPKTDDLIVGATGVLFGSMRGRGGSGPEKDVPSTTSAPTATITPAPAVPKGRWQL
jgi:hypothetical protein